MLRVKEFGVGVDCEQISRFEKMDKGFVQKIFTKKEIDYCMKKSRPSQHFAARFAGKEAIIKCFGSLGKKIFLSQIEILKCANGAPAVKILDKKLNSYDIRLSISHSGSMALAFAVVLKTGV